MPSTCRGRRSSSDSRRTAARRMALLPPWWRQRMRPVRRGQPSARPSCRASGTLHLRHPRAPDLSLPPKPRFYAIGGGIEKDRPAIVGENGPELIIPKTRWTGVHGGRDPQVARAVYADFSRAMKSSAVSRRAWPHRLMPVCPTMRARAVDAHWATSSAGISARPCLPFVELQRPPAIPEELATTATARTADRLTNHTDLQVRQQGVRQAMAHEHAAGHTDGTGCDEASRKRPGNCDRHRPTHNRYPVTARSVALSCSRFRSPRS